MQKFLAKDDFDLVQINPDMVFVGLEAIARYSEDNSLYRCNKEDQPISGLVRMPSVL